MCAELESASTRSASHLSKWANQGCVILQSSIWKPKSRLAGPCHCPVCPQAHAGRVTILRSNTCVSSRQPCRAGEYRQAEGISDESHPPHTLPSRVSAASQRQAPHVVMPPRLITATRYSPPSPSIMAPCTCHSVGDHGERHLTSSQWLFSRPAHINGHMKWRCLHAP